MQCLIDLHLVKVILDIFEVTLLMFIVMLKARTNFSF